MTVLQEIEDLRQKLRYYSDKYYNDDAPEIEDYQYDMMMRRLESLEQAINCLDYPAARRILAQIVSELDEK